MANWLNTPIQTQFRVIDGLSIRFAESGYRDDHALLLSPWPESLLAFEPVWSRLAERAHLVAIDLPGFGRSQRRDALLSPLAMGEFIIRAADAFGLGHPHVIGPDIGTAAALFAAAAHPGRLRSLVVGSGGSAVPLQLGSRLKDWVESPDLKEFNRVDPRQIVAGALTGIQRHALPDFIREDYLSSYEGDRMVESCATCALVHLQFALDFLARAHILAGELTAAARLIEEDRLIAEATGNPPVAYTAMTLAAWRGQQAHAHELIEATVQEATARGLGRPLNFAAYASSVLYNGLGRHDAARDAAWPAFERDQLGYGPFIVPELAEAASRTGDVALVRAALQWLSERTQMTPTEWALGIQARIRALLSDGEDAERLYRESIARLGRTRVRAELARSHLLYGEWLRRERRRADAREQLRTAHAMLDTMGIGAFAERARRELLATGETARKRTVETSGQLTAQEAQVARLARDGLSNPQISARLFISPRTVRYHLTKVFTKLGITSRSQLDRVLPDPDTAAPR